MSPMPSYDQLIAHLNEMRRKAIAFVWASHLGFILAIVSLCFVGLTLATALFIPSIGLRVALLAALGIIIAALILWAIAKSTVWAPRHTHLALAVEDSNPALKNRLIASLQLADRARSNPEQYSLELIDLTIRQAAQLCEQTDFAAALDRSRMKRALRWGGIGLGAAILVAVLFPGLSMRSWEAYSNPLTDYSPPVPFALSVEPGSTEAVKFDDFKIVARVNGSDLPRTMTVYHRIEGGGWRSIGPVASVGPEQVLDDKNSQREFRQVIPQIKHDFDYYVQAGEVRSPIYSVTAVDRPRVTGLRMEVLYPKYTGLQTQVIDENDGTISAPVGTDMKMRIASNRRLASATIMYSDGEQLPLEVRPDYADAEFKVQKNRSYHFVLIDESGRTNPHPIEYPVTAIPDRDPSVEIVLPGHNMDLDDNMAVDMKIVARDDYGFNNVVLHTRWLSEGRERAVREFEIPDGKGQAERLELGYFWDLAGWGMMPEDVIHYYVEVTDNDAVTGPKTAQSKTYTVRLPSLDEMIAEYESSRDADILSLDKILEGERELQQKIDELRRDLAQNQPLDWERQKNLQDLTSQGKQLEKELDQIAESMQQQLEQAQKQKLQSVEMLQKMAEAQELFKEIATEEMKEAMRKLQEAMEQLDPKDVEKALSEMNLSQEEMIKRLDRTIDYFKRLQAEQKVDTFVRRLEEMLNQQNALNDEANKSQAEQLPDLAPSQDRLKNDFNELAGDMAAAESLLTTNKVAPEDQVKQFCNSAQKSDAPSHMQKASQGMNDQQKEQAGKEGEKSSESLAALLEEMKSFQQNMASKLKEQLAKQMREALDKTLYLSEKQEDLLDQSEQLDPNSLSLRDMAAEQEALRAATERLAQEVAEMSKKSSCLSGQLGQCLSNSIGQMQSSAQSLSDRRGSSARNSQRDAMSDLNAAAQQLAKGMDKNAGQCQNPGSCDNPGNSGMGKMKSLAQRQGRLNQEMPGPTGSGKMSLEERQALSRLKAEQQAIQRGVDDLHSDIGDDRSQLGRLDKLSEEMKRVVESMEKSDVSEETLERQRRIYTRMLDFQHSLEKQDYKEERKARFGEDILRASPDQLDDSHGLTDEEYQRLMTRYQEEGYPPEYENVIREYFRALVEARGK